VLHAAPLWRRSPALRAAAMTHPAIAENGALDPERL
jgi:hypothetical protein